MEMRSEEELFAEALRMDGMLDEAFEARREYGASLDQKWLDRTLATRNALCWALGWEGTARGKRAEEWLKELETEVEARELNNDRTEEE